MPNLSTEDIIQEFNRLFAEEIEAAMRYLHLLNAVRGLDRLIVEPKLRQGFQETTQHAEIIAQKIRALGGIPKLEISISCPAEPLTAKEALNIALTFEEAALEAYQDMLRRVEGDVPLEEFIRSQVASESAHVAEIKELLA
ncbi:MAG: ferritin-like domain-containing protein [Planctomycetes bacterium]|nr:ferritin-like domain-containing protein [Planctomycetota bacterium]